MNPIKKLFDGIAIHVDVDDLPKASLKGEAWWNNIQTDTEAMNTTAKYLEDVKAGVGGTQVPMWVRTLKIWSNDWVGTLVWIILYFIFLGILDDISRPETPEQLKEGDEISDTNRFVRRRI
jgi:hypothetical protein